MRIGVYGNLTLDELCQNGEHLVRPGGSALYSSLAAAYLGARVSIFSSIGRDYPRNTLSSISSNLIDLAGVKKFDGLTTRFRISYSADSRRLEVVHPGQRLRPGRILRSLQAIHLGHTLVDTQNSSHWMYRGSCGLRGQKGLFAW